MNIQPFILPKPVGNVLSILPGYPQTLLFVHAVNLVLGDTLRSEVMRPLQGKLISIRATDAGVVFYLVLHQLHCEFFFNVGESGFSITPIPS